ncbi:hypothetical protein ANCDUO_24434 [Ancylostoma duodenale]|uniref:Helicase ATP-binding domain-containing protein n=1 Tax=Ancylostoma duodenale TaxID=51022 RepID=A0A0C2FAH0_9BILA|nr:hypothetical protein ANCDUO_24434 [Ancylostoma duodenale]
MLTQDDAARDISHIILDEIHEREQNTDYLLIALKQALKKRNDLKVRKSRTDFQKYKYFVGNLDVSNNGRKFEAIYEVFWRKG